MTTIARDKRKFAALPGRSLGQKDREPDWRRGAVNFT
jgi:hypothetical protein